MTATTRRSAAETLALPSTPRGAIVNPQSDLTPATQPQSMAFPRSPGPWDLCDVREVEPGDGMTRALDTYLDMAYEIESTADGWVLLRGPQDRLALTVAHRLKGGIGRSKRKE